MQFTFSVNQPTSTALAVPVQNSDFKPSAEFKDNVTHRTRPITRSTATQEDTQPNLANDQDTHHTQHNPNDANVGFCTGTIRVGPDDTAPAPLDTAPLQGWGTHRTRFFKVLMLNRGFI
jgi:hypothetical protein